MKDLTKLTLVSCGAIGYHTGNVKTTSILMPTEMYEQFKEQISMIEIEFDDLDGKHAHVMGDTQVSNEYYDIKEHLANLDDYEQLLDYTYGIVGEENNDELRELNRSIHENTRVTTVVKVEYYGEEV